jgi:hypothetical protein
MAAGFLRLRTVLRVVSGAVAGKMAASQAWRIGASTGAAACACTGVQASRTATKRSVDLMLRAYHRRGEREVAKR